MLTLKNLTRYTPETFISGVIYLRDDEGNDWYESQKLFREDTWKIVYGGDGIICSCAKDVTMLYPANMSVTEVDSLPAWFEADLTWRFDGAAVVKITPKRV
ncbi:tail fiber assembly protein [Salmonella enterica]|nr:tail fiber assembly protein [Salmonella enterica]